MMMIEPEVSETKGSWREPPLALPYLAEHHRGVVHARAAAISGVSGLLLLVITKDPPEAETLQQGKRLPVATEALMVRGEDETARVAEDAAVEVLAQGALQADASIVLEALEHIIERSSSSGTCHKVEGRRAGAGDTLVVELEKARGLFIRGLVVQLLGRLDASAYRSRADIRAGFHQRPGGAVVRGAEQEQSPDLEDRGCVAVEPR